MRNFIAWLAGSASLSLIPGVSSDRVGSGPVGSRQNTGRIRSLDFNYPRGWVGNGSDWLGSISGRGPHIGPELSSTVKGEVDRKLWIMMTISTSLAQV